MTANTMHEESASHTPKRWLGRSVAAVVAGLVLTTAASYALDALVMAGGYMAKDGVLPQSGAAGLVAFVLFYRTLCSVAGCYVAARLARRRPVTHALILGGLGALAGIAGALTLGDQAPAWYGWGLVVLALPAALVGGLLARGRFHDLTPQRGEQVHHASS